MDMDLTIRILEEGNVGKHYLDWFLDEEDCNCIIILLIIVSFLPILRDRVFFNWSSFSPSSTASC